MGIQINGQTDTITATDGSFTIQGASGNLTGDLVGNVTGNLTGNVNSTGVTTVSSLRIGTGASISSPSTNVLTLGTNNTESVRINSTGVGIGTNNPTTTLDVGGEITIRRTAAGNEGGQINFARASDNAVAWNIDAYGSTSTPSLRFIDATIGASRVEIDGSGNLKLPTAGTKVLNSSGNPILNQTGSILQVVQTVKTDTFTTSASGNTAITGLSASITPSSTSNKILVMYSINYDSNRGNSGGGFRIFRDGSHITASSGAAAGNRYTVSGDFGANANADQSGMHRSFTYLDSPSSISSLTYQIYIYQDSTSFTTYINRARTDGNEADDPRMSSTITLMEVAG